MIAKKERITEKPKTTMLRVRVDNELLEKLDKVVEKEQSSRSHVIRDGIEKAYSELE